MTLFFSHYVARECGCVRKCSPVYEFLLEQRFDARLIMVGAECVLFTSLPLQRTCTCYLIRNWKASQQETITHARELIAFETIYVCERRECSGRFGVDEGERGAPLRCWIIREVLQELLAPSFRAGRRRMRQMGERCLSSGRAKVTRWLRWRT